VAPEDSIREGGKLHFTLIGRFHLAFKSGVLTRRSLPEHTLSAPDDYADALVGSILEAVNVRGSFHHLPSIVGPLAEGREDADICLGIFFARLSAHQNTIVKL
jgi:hypothetical protein